MAEMGTLCGGTPNRQFTKCHNVLALSAMLGVVSTCMGLGLESLGPACSLQRYLPLALQFARGRRKVGIHRLELLAAIELTCKVFSFVTI